MTAPVLAGPVLAAPASPPVLRPATGLAADLARARSALLEAQRLSQPDGRFLAGHLVALRVAAVVLAAASRPGGARGRPRNAWRALAQTVPELSGWASLFAATEDVRDAISGGAVDLVDAAAADDVVRAAGQFLGRIDHALTTGARAPGPAVQP